MRGELATEDYTCGAHVRAHAFDCTNVDFPRVCVHVHAWYMWRTCTVGAAEDDRPKLKGLFWVVLVFGRA